MTLWDVTFQISRPLQAFPMPRRVACETQSDASYRCEGRDRQGRGNLFVYTLGGLGMFRDRGQVQALPAGAGFLCRSVCPEIAWYYPEAGLEPWKFVWLHFDGDTADAMVTEMTQAYGHIYHVLEKGVAVQRLMALRGTQPSSVCSLMSHAGSDLVFGLLIALAASVEERPLDSPRTGLIRQAQDVITRGMERNVSIAEVAAQFNLSREHFSRLFRAQTGLAPGEYAQQQKMLSACRLLKESRLSCKEIAVKLGYTNQTNFSRAFQSLMHTSPRDFRKGGSLATQG